MLLIIEALLILAALGQDHRAAVAGLNLDMAVNSVDDYYYGCRVKMAEKVEKEYLVKDRGNPKFNNAWEEGERKAVNAGANVEKYSRLPYEKEVLIPPYEKFRITGIKTRQTQKDLWCETVITLKHDGARSELNCALFKKKTRPEQTIMV
ncbi:NAD(P)(+)--arginine ADP-ribosyltransferase 2-like [Pimephales promelas]|nr:NAD(P)(+)--arginine ADP-ribosyltransferase 2-like [Pimephales promelas]